MELGQLTIYRQAREISGGAWEIYGSFSWETRKIIGDQFITAVDSVGANIAEGWGRFHFLDRNRFNYNARGSLTESLHWLELLLTRGLVDASKGIALKNKIRTLHYGLNNYISSIKKQKAVSKITRQSPT